MNDLAKRLTREQIESWNTHFKAQALAGDINMKHWEELRALCDMALRGSVSQAEPVAWMCRTRERLEVTMYEDQTFGEVTLLYAAPPAAEPGRWPQPSSENAADGWLIDFAFLKSVKSRLTDYPSLDLEEIEAVLLATAPAKGEKP